MMMILMICWQWWQERNATCHSPLLPLFYTSDYPVYNFYIYNLVSLLILQWTSYNFNKKRQPLGSSVVVPLGVETGISAYRYACIPSDEFPTSCFFLEFGIKAGTPLMGDVLFLEYRPKKGRRLYFLSLSLYYVSHPHAWTDAPYCVASFWRPKLW